MQRTVENLLGRQLRAQVLEVERLEVGCKAAGAREPQVRRAGTSKARKISCRARRVAIALPSSAAVAAAAAAVVAAFRRAKSAPSLL